MDLPVNPPVEPMLAKPVSKIPDEPGMTFEPKWDGYRCIIFRDGDEVELASRGGKTLTRYFPEVVNQALKQFPARSVIDCELVCIRRDTGRIPRLDFDMLNQRIHPAASRVNKLSVETPADIIAFDLLALDDRSLMDQPYAQRRALLAQTLAHVEPPVHLTPVTTDADTAREWFTAFEGAGLDGLITKPAAMPYSPGKRLMLKIKHARTADVVVAGFRYHTSGPVVGSLLLGLYDEHGVLHHVGASSAFTAARRAELLDELEPYRNPAEHTWGSASDGQRVPGAPSRWSGGKDLGFEPLRPELVVEVGYDAMEGDRFRHTAQFKRWRPDRDPRSCTYDQLDRPISLNVDEVLRTP
ncbi:ATP-dependent DNA ligase [Catellatospora sichuanensis]|uniref:ATP-dependent DNA ligase n=1 Tax=Catellatospora sichuanensis TaxID=1969805 RepID=UPI001183101E|nr:ATP-dependent DNA ligase [Catellatospora sichuanensis]